MAALTAFFVVKSEASAANPGTITVGGTVAQTREFSQTLSTKSQVSVESVILAPGEAIHGTVQLRWGVGERLQNQDLVVAAVSRDRRIIAEMSLHIGSAGEDYFKLPVPEGETGTFSVWVSVTSFSYPIVLSDAPLITIAPLVDDNEDNPRQKKKTDDVSVLSRGNGAVEVTSFPVGGRQSSVSEGATINITGPGHDARASPT